MTAPRRFDLLAFDADDTLWHDLHKYYAAEEQFIELLSRYQDRQRVRKRLFEIDIKNLKLFGYGAKGYTLSMIEAAIDLSDGRITGHELREVVAFGRSIIEHPIELLPHAAETLAHLHRTHMLMLITKGDLFDQETKLARSGLADYFHHIEIVSLKEPATYRFLLMRYGIDPARFMMVGNSLKSDILPVVAVGGHAVFIPAHITWEHEHVEDAPPHGYAVLEHLGQLPTYLAEFEGK